MAANLMEASPSPDSEGTDTENSFASSVSVCLSGKFPLSPAFFSRRSSADESKEPGSLMVPGKAPSVLSVTSVAEPREDAEPDLRNGLSLVFSVALWLCGE
jgi:hypothetical protein